MIDYEKYLKELQKEYDDKSFQIKDKIIEHWKNVEQRNTTQSDVEQQNQEQAWFSISSVVCCCILI